MPNLAFSSAALSWSPCSPSYETIAASEKRRMEVTVGKAEAGPIWFFLNAFMKSLCWGAPRRITDDVRPNCLVTAARLVAAEMPCANIFFY